MEKHVSKRELKKQELLKQARFIFTDSLNYSNHQLINYCRLIKQLVPENELTKNSFSISSIENYLQSRKNDLAKIIYLYFFENYTFATIEMMLNTSAMTIYKTKLKELELLRDSLDLLKIANNIFIDSEVYSEDKIIGYCKILREITPDFNYDKNSVSIKTIEKILKTHEHANFIYLHFFENYTFGKIGKKFNLSTEKVKRTIESELKLLSQELKLSNEAKRIFTDANRYSEENLVGFCKLLKDSANNNDLPDNFVSISKLKKILQSRKTLYYKVMYLYFVKKLNLIQIANEFSLTPEGVRRIKLKQLELIRNKLKL